MRPPKDMPRAFEGMTASQCSNKFVGLHYEDLSGDAEKLYDDLWSLASRDTHPASVAARAAGNDRSIHWWDMLTESQRQLLKEAAKKGKEA